MKKIVITVFIIVFLAAILTYAANDTFLGDLYAWVIGIIEDVFGVNGGATPAAPIRLLF